MATVEETAVAEIEAALQAQLEATREIGGGTLNKIVAGATAVWVSDGRLLEAVKSLLLGGAAVGMQVAAVSLPSEFAMNWELADEAAGAWVDDYAFDLVTGINETSAKRLRSALSRWIDGGGTLAELADDVRPIFADEPATRWIEAIFNIDRATMIAETEATRAYAQGKVAAYTASGLADLPPERVPPDDSHVRCRCDVSLEKRNGVWYWIWLTARDDFVCPICKPLHNQMVGLAKKDSKRLMKRKRGVVNYA